jgi:hypothetical protein
MVIATPNAHTPNAATPLRRYTPFDILTGHT